MGRRRAHQHAGPAEIVDVMPVSARVAWSYLASVLAAVGAALVVVLSNQTLARLLCTGGSADDSLASCKLGWAIWAGLAGFVLCLIPAVLLLKLGWWLWATMFAGTGFLIATDSITEWWWWVAAVFVPAVAALLSADWQLGRSVRRVQLGLVLVLDAGAVGALLWWYVNG